MELIELEKFKRHSTKSMLRDFYRRMEQQKNLSSSEDRKKFFALQRAEFVSILRLGRGVSDESASEMVGMPSQSFKKLESGELMMTDSMFFRICALYLALNEASVFLERIEEALKPGLRESRAQLAPTLRQYGFTFADGSKYETSRSQEGVVLRFPGARR